MRKDSILVIAAIGAVVLALAACQQQRQEISERRSEKSQLIADDARTSTSSRDAANAALQSQLDADLRGKFTPPDPEGFVEEGGTLEQAGGAEMRVVFGRWTRLGPGQRIMLVQKIVGPDVEDDQGRTRMRAQIVQVFPMPVPRDNESFFTENCTSSEYSQQTAYIYANASTAPARPGEANTPSAAWRFDRQAGRLMPIDASRVTCAFDAME